MEEDNKKIEEIVELLEKYSLDVEKIKNNDSMEKEDKDNLFDYTYLKYSNQAEEIAKNYDIGIDDIENINEEIAESNIEDKKEIEESTNEESKEYDDRGLPRVPGKIYRGD